MSPIRSTLLLPIGPLSKWYKYCVYVILTLTHVSGQYVTKWNEVDGNTNRKLATAIFGIHFESSIVFEDLLLGSTLRLSEAGVAFGHTSRSAR